MMNVYKRTAFLAVLVGSVWFAPAQLPIHAQQPSSVAVPVNNVQLVIEGKVVKVHDGDTVTVLDQDNKKFNIRLQGIDAPELKQEFGAASQKNLSGMVLGKQVKIFWNKVDKYRRTVGTIMLDGRDINIEQVKAGVAWHYKKYEDEQSPADRLTYAAAEESARAAKLGLWNATSVVAPSEWRQEVKLKRWGPPPPEGTIIGNGNSKKYHRPDCPGYRDMAERNRVFFKSVEEAEAAGFKRAGNCPAAAVVATRNTPATVAITSTSPVADAARATTTVSSSPVTVTVNSGSTVAQPAQPMVQSGQSLLKIVGNKNSKIFHQPWCSGYERVSEKNRVFFESVSEAEAAGYKRAGNCRAEAADVKMTRAPSPGAVKASNSEVSTQPANVPPVPTATNVKAVPALVADDKATVESSQSSLKIVGNKNSKIFHQPWCSGYDRVSEKNRVYFNSAAEAETEGYRLAKNCGANNPN
jgi:endonuclease YncB( thermonuclease family)/methylphosphotriester-DNA--protein-cysteine methyltransferase